MLKVLINSYTCCPNMGSEQGMGWNWIVSLAKYCEVYVVSEGEYREIINRWISNEKLTINNEKLSQNDPRNFANRMHFYWNPVDQGMRDKCWNQGNWSFYPLYAKWQKKTADIARGICKEHEIDILHQLNMIGFREPGCLADVSKETGIPLVWGPIGGLKMFPMAYASGLKMKAFNWLKNTITKWQIAHDKRVVETLKRSSVLISSIPDSYKAIKKYHGLESVIIPETGCNLNEEFKIQNSKLSDRFKNDTLKVMWVGKFDFRKRLDIAIEAVRKVNTDIADDSVSLNGNLPKIKLSVYGTGNENQVDSARSLADGCAYIEFMGNQPHDVVQKAMRNSDVFLFTSVNEDTSTVVLEAVSSGLPVVCFDACGMAAVIDEKVGIKIPLTNPGQSIKDFANVLTDLYEHRYKLKAMSANCPARAEELSWDNKARQVVELYKRVIK